MLCLINMSRVKLTEASIPPYKDRMVIGTSSLILMILKSYFLEKKKTYRSPQSRDCLLKLYSNSQIYKYIRSYGKLKQRPVI